MPGLAACAPVVHVLVALALAVGLRAAAARIAGCVVAALARCDVVLEATIAWKLASNINGELFEPKDAETPGKSNSWIFRFLKSGPVHTPKGPAGGGGRSESEESISDRNGSLPPLQPGRQPSCADEID